MDTDYRALGQDERILVKSFSEGLVFGYQLVKAIGSPATLADYAAMSPSIASRVA